MPHDGAGVVERYLERLVAHDWEAMAACLAEDVVRVGPFGDTYTPRGDYVAFLSALMPTLPGYGMRIERVVHSGTVTVVELTETIDAGGAAVETPEALVFDIDDDGLIAHIAIYIQRLGEIPVLP
ncbi:MAG TPA: nuclear transport factor 2 family protein [Acidimicrobiales bacterium]|nr:nuclear transport factor 2 family protein [Acidimicrobiales bacterium]